MTDHKTPEALIEECSERLLKALEAMKAINEHPDIGPCSEGGQALWHSNERQCFVTAGALMANTGLILHHKLERLRASRKATDEAIHNMTGGNHHEQH